MRYLHITFALIVAIAVTTMTAVALSPHENVGAFTATSGEADWDAFEWVWSSRTEKIDAGFSFDISEGSVVLRLFQEEGGAITLEAEMTEVSATNAIVTIPSTNIPVWAIYKAEICQIEETDPVQYKTLARGTIAREWSAWDTTNFIGDTASVQLSFSYDTNSAAQWNAAWTWVNTYSNVTPTYSWVSTYVSTTAVTVAASNLLYYTLTTDYTDTVFKADAAHGWGDHGGEGYLTAETDPVWTNAQATGFTMGAPINMGNQHITNALSLRGGSGAVVQFAGPNIILTCTALSMANSKIVNASDGSYTGTLATVDYILDYVKFYAIEAGAGINVSTATVGNEITYTVASTGGGGGGGYADLLAQFDGAWRTDLDDIGKASYAIDNAQNVFLEFDDSAYEWTAYQPVSVGPSAGTNFTAVSLWWVSSTTGTVVEAWCVDGVTNTFTHHVSETTAATAKLHTNTVNGTWSDAIAIKWGQDGATGTAAGDINGRVIRLEVGQQ